MLANIIMFAYHTPFHKTIYLFYNLLGILLNQFQFADFEIFEKALIEEVKRLGIETSREVLTRCKKLGKNWSYALKSLTNEGANPSPSSADPLPTVDEVPAGYMPGESIDSIRRMCWREDYAYMAKNEPENLAAWVAKWAQPVGVMA